MNRNRTTKQNLLVERMRDPFAITDRVSLGRIGALLAPTSHERAWFLTEACSAIMAIDLLFGMPDKL